MTSRIWFITGASRGIGLDIARAALNSGHRVVATSRNKQDVVAALGSYDALLALDLDVTRPEQISAAVEAAKNHFGGIDVLVNNAGYGHIGMFEEVTDAEVRAQFETNVFGLFSVTRAVLPLMRVQRAGHVINLSSVAGFVGFGAASIYCASKFAVEGFSLSLAEEVKPFGIHVTLVAPGFIRTDFLDPKSIRGSKPSVADYAEASAQVLSTFDQYNHQQPGDPARLAEAVLQLADSQQPPLRYAGGSDAVQMVESRLAQLSEELNALRALSQSVDGQWS